MSKETRTIRYDEELRIEAYRLEGTCQTFPNHFHDYYVIGFVEKGMRHLSCKNKEYTIRPGQILLFNPNDSHGCSQCGSETLDYGGLNISRETMLSLAEGITGERNLPVFSENVIRNEELNASLHALHRMILEGSGEFEKEETFLLLLSLLIEQYGQAFSKTDTAHGKEIERACAFMKENFAERITLEELCQCSGMSKSTLLRAFTKEKGVTPYRYLQSVRIGEAKKLLERGVSPADAALQAGFSDQSHFTNFFNMFTGLSPAAYGRIFKENGKNNG